MEKKESKEPPIPPPPPFPPPIRKAEEASALSTANVDSNDSKVVGNNPISLSKEKELPKESMEKVKPSADAGVVGEVKKSEVSNLEESKEKKDSGIEAKTETETVPSKASVTVGEESEIMKDVSSKEEVKDKDPEVLKSSTSSEVRSEPAVEEKPQTESVNVPETSTPVKDVQVETKSLASHSEKEAEGGTKAEELKRSESLVSQGRQENQKIMESNMKNEKNVKESEQVLNEIIDSVSETETISNEPKNDLNLQKITDEKQESIKENDASTGVETAAVIQSESQEKETKNDALAKSLIIEKTHNEKASSVAGGHGMVDAQEKAAETGIETSLTGQSKDAASESGLIDANGKQVDVGKQDLGSDVNEKENLGSGEKSSFSSILAKESSKNVPELSSEKDSMPKAPPISEDSSEMATLKAKTTDGSGLGEVEKSISEEKNQKEPEDRKDPGVTDQDTGVITKSNPNSVISSDSKSDGAMVSKVEENEEDQKKEEKKQQLVDTKEQPEIMSAVTNGSKMTKESPAVPSPTKETSVKISEMETPTKSEDAQTELKQAPTPGSTPGTPKVEGEPTENSKKRKLEESVVPEVEESRVLKLLKPSDKVSGIEDQQLKEDSPLPLPPPLVPISKVKAVDIKANRKREREIDDERRQKEIEGKKSAKIQDSRELNEAVTEERSEKAEIIKSKVNMAIDSPSIKESAPSSNEEKRESKDETKVAAQDLNSQHEIAKVKDSQDGNRQKPANQEKTKNTTASSNSQDTKEYVKDKIGADKETKPSKTSKVKRKANGVVGEKTAGKTERSGKRLKLKPDEVIKSSTIKRIMKIDKDVKMTATEAVFLVSKATECFLGKMMEHIHKEALKGSKKGSISYNDMAKTVKQNPDLEFLTDLLPEV